MCGCNVGTLSQTLNKAKPIAELTEALQLIWDDLPPRPIDKTVKDFSKRLKACVEADGGLFEYSK